MPCCAPQPARLRGLAGRNCRGFAHFSAYGIEDLTRLYPTARLRGIERDVNRGRAEPNPRLRGAGNLWMPRILWLAIHPYRAWSSRARHDTVDGQCRDWRWCGLCFRRRQLRDLTR